MTPARAAAKEDFEFNPGGGTPLYCLDADVPLDRVLFFTSVRWAPDIDRVYNFV